MQHRHKHQLATVALLVLRLGQEKLRSRLQQRGRGETALPGQNEVVSMDDGNGAWRPFSENLRTNVHFLP